MKTRITELLGIEYPIIQGGMAWVADYHLVSAVSEAGGLGIIGAGAAPADWVREQIRKVKENTDKPFGVNIMLLNPAAEEIAKVVVEEGVAMVTTGAGNPERFMKMWKEAGIKVLPVVASIGLAKRMVRSGCDGLIAEGTEAGGHIGDLTTMVLVPQLASEFDIPVVAAGGIADGRGLAATLMLGAEGVQIGTRFVATDEANVHENYKNAILKAKDIDSKVTGRTTGHPVRTLRNAQTLKYIKLEQEGTNFEELERLTEGGLRRAVVEGDVKTGSIMAGQIAGLIKTKMSVEDVILSIMAEAKHTIKESQKYV
ncbi:MAG: enoyl-[acyl-carrier-protein] reductase FabK [Peptostreptococcaceae bacterium]|nr:enoyl-[acyl-carrier-protein] reductase FabK [Peptostreptococcaceae bacterium]